MNAAQPAGPSQPTLPEVEALPADFEASPGELDALEALREAQQVARIGSWILEPGSGAGFWSREMYALFGRDSCDGPPAFDEFLACVHPEDHARLLAAHERALSEGTPAAFEFRGGPPSGPSRVFFARVERRDTERGTPRLVGTVEDITERERLRGQAEAASALLSRMLERVSDGFVALDTEWRYTYVNQRAAELLGRQRPEDLVGKHIWTEYPEGEDQPFAERYREAVESQKPIVFQDYYEPWDRWFENRLYPGPDGLTIYFTEITERKRAERTVRQMAERLDLTVRSTGIGLWDWDLIVGTVEYSDEWKRQIGYEPQEISNDLSEWERRVHPEDLAPTMTRIRNFLSVPVGDHEVEFRMRHKNGDYRWILARGAVVRDEDGTPVRMLGVHLDITDRRRAEDELRALAAELEARVARRTAELEARNRELEMFSYSVSHDLKAPLRGIEGYSRLLEEDHADQLDGEGHDFVRTIRRAALEMGQLIDDLLEYSRVERRTLNPTTLDLDAFVETLLDQRIADAAARGITLRRTLPPASVTADPTGLTVAIGNLVDNAIKFSADRPDAEVTVTLRPCERSWVVEVRDNGIGFDMTYHDRIFEVFQRLHPNEEYAGTGVGLALVRRVAERIGGRVWAESAPGRGATFFLEIPR